MKTPKKLVLSGNSIYTQTEVFKCIERIISRNAIHNLVRETGTHNEFHNSVTTLWNMYGIEVRRRENT